MLTIHYLLLAACFLVALCISRVVLPNILLISHKKRLFDKPDEKRKMHHVPIPRLGGVSFYPVIVITLGISIVIYHLSGLHKGLMTPQTLYEFVALATGGMMLFLTGLADDLIGIGYKRKFLVQLIAASLLVSAGVWIRSLEGLLGLYALPAWIGMPFTVFIMVYVTNAINLIDGIDGLASGLCIIALLFLAMLHIHLHMGIYALLALAALGVLMPFWVINVFGNERRGRKLFMGDSGSLALGYILTFLIIHLSKVDVASGAPMKGYMVLGLSTLLVPLLDVVRVVVHRVRTGKNPFLPDKNHIHHKLLQVGLRVRQVMATIILLAILFIVVNACLLGTLNVTLILTIDLLIWLVFHAALDVMLYKKAKKTGN